MEAERDRLRARLGEAEVMDLVTLREATDRARREGADAQANAAARQADLVAVEAELGEKRARIVETDERLLLQEFGLYEPKYRLATVAEYKARLDALRAEQSNMVKKGTACHSATKWEVNGSQTEGAKMIRDYTRLIVRAFNTECDGTVEAVKFYNLEASRNRIQKSYDLLNRLGARMSIQITPIYLRSKLNELDLAFEFQIKKQKNS